MSLIVWVYRQLFYCKRRLCPTKHVLPDVPASKLPWFWVGAKLLDETVCVTDIVNRQVKYGVPITSKLLSELTHIHEGATWKYVDAKTLEEKEFPPEGIVIENDAIYQSILDT